YRKHLFSESNNENTSTGQSEKSWILDSQNPPLPKSADYTRKRPRVRSKFKGKLGPPLTLSCVTSCTADKEGASRQRVRKSTLRKKSTSGSKGDDVPTVDLADETLSEELEGGQLSLDPSAKDHSGDEKKAMQFRDASGKLSREEESLKRKDSDILSGAAIKKPKLSSWETSSLPSDTSYKPRKLFDSVEKEEEIQAGNEVDDSVDDVFFSKMLREDFSDSGVIAAFESFSDQLKKSFWSWYKRMETDAQNALRTSEKTMSALLNQIHEC
ncbi:SYC2L protein, partial [Syrrhaptes paradoxus]|nr:SYC2L protein [Syrrhaptes paradoxus]